MKESGVSGAPQGPRARRDRRDTQASLERRASPETEVILDPVDLQESRAVLESEDRRDTEASEETGAKTERTG